ncbi:MAG: hypothetical protein IJM99_06185 [Firmicutes bacterium]|nr:hypothetical protein [Bacillota bacterium]
MNKLYGKMIVIVAQLILALSMVVMSSYAWMTLSTNPSVEGIQIAIGGGNTILVAADVAETVDGVTYHYPSYFSDTLNFNQFESYNYLNHVSELTPVSTADGIHWFLPEYYDVNDEEVKAGIAMVGQVKPVEEFTLDDTLEHANLDDSQVVKAKQGSYTYVDFWVVSPGSEYTLRVSTGDDSGGSFAIGLDPVIETNGQLVLDTEAESAAACVRAGFLVNPDGVLDNSMLYYQKSPGFNEQYTRLRGTYKEPEGTNIYSSGYQFYIYEPNGDSNGSYTITEPLGVTGSAIGVVAYPVDVRDRLTVQKTSHWMTATTGAGTEIEQRFSAAMLEYQMAYPNLSEKEAASKFYREYLGGQVGPYVKKGSFLKNTGDLYEAAVDGIVSEFYLGEGFTAGATDDTYIVKLEKNVPQRIRLFVWLEGQDVDCINCASASSFSLKLELAGSNADINE